MIIVFKTKNSGLTDYKIHNFNGIPKIVLVCKDRFEKTGMTEDFFSIEWQHLEVGRPGVERAREEILKPTQIDKMLSISRALSKGIPFLRTDFYIINDRLYVGELTFYPASGFTAFIPEEWDFKLGSWIPIQ